MVFKRRNKTMAPDTPRPTPTSTTESGLSSIVDASRRISAQRSAPAIWRQAISEAVAMTGAEVGAFLLAPTDEEPGPFRFADESHPEFFAAPELAGAQLLSAIHQRRPECLVVTDEPAFAVTPVSVALTPCIGRGQLIGVLLVIRPPDDPFGNQAIEILELLGPVTGAALAGATTTRSADDLDGVTQLANRRRLDRDFDDLSRGGRIGFASLKIDQFVSFTEQHSEAEAEDLLRQVALTVTSSIRPTDVAYRIGPDEFGILLPGANRMQAAWVAERVRQSITAVTLAGLADSRFTASIGVTSGEHDDAQELAERARTAMLEAEEQGKDRVVADDLT